MSSKALRLGDEPSAVTGALVAAGGAGVPALNADAFEANLKQAERIRGMVLAMLKKGLDFGTVPGIKRPFLFQPGASKICIGLGVMPEYELERVEESAGLPQGPLLAPYRVRARCKLLTKGSRILVYEGPWRGASSEERTFAGRVQRKPLLGELVGEMEKADPKGWPAFVLELDRRSRYGQKYAQLKQAVIYGLMKQDSLANALEMVRAAYESAETLGAVYESIDTRAQKRAYVHATRGFAGVEDVYAQDEDLVAEEKGKADAAAKAAATTAGDVKVTGGADGAAEAVAKPAGKTARKAAGKGAAPVIVVTSTAEPVVTATVAATAATPMANAKQMVAISAICVKLGVDADAGCKLVGVKIPLTFADAATAIERLTIRVNQKQAAAQKAADRGKR